MKYASDITELFRSFGTRTGSYQKIQPNYKHFKDGLVTPTLEPPSGCSQLPPGAPANRGEIAVNSHREDFNGEDERYWSMRSRQLRHFRSARAEIPESA